MKNILNVLTLSAFALLSSCNTDVFNNSKNDSIEFPKFGLVGGENVLAGNVENLDEDAWYSLAADVNTDETIRVVFQNTSKEEQEIDVRTGTPISKRAIWYYDVGSKTGWTVSSYDFDNGTQIFACDGIVYSELRIKFDRNNTDKGSAIIDIYIGNNEDKEPFKSIEVEW